MMRKKLTNKSKFQFKEEEMLPPAGVPSRGSVQSRLTRKADNKPAYNPTVPAGHAQPIRQVITVASQIAPHARQQYPGGPDPVLDAVVAKLKSVHPNTPCVCMRPLKLIMCQECGVTFPARLRMPCVNHPHNTYLLDVEECKGCCQTDKNALVEYDLPKGMEAGFKNVLI